jgi:alpha-L-glutamate ligase-like protein
LQTKRLAQKAGIPTPPLYEVLSLHHQLLHLDSVLSGYNDFVVKPAHGSGGDGILVIDGQKANRYHKVNGEILSVFELRHHIASILGGLYSLGGQADTALIEYRILFDPVFSSIAYQGVPDIRIIVFLGVPVMAMLRLPTRQSQGKANLHQGAIGVGINIENGATTTAISGNQQISEHPDTGHQLHSVMIPHWDSMLLTASRCYELTGLGYIGADFVLDRDKGPLLLELNARPGLNIQIANHAGLVSRLRQVQAATRIPANAEQRVQFAKQEFRV